MIRFIITCLLYLFAVGCSGASDTDPNLPPKTVPPSKPAEMPCPATQAMFVCTTPGQSCWFYRDAHSQTLCTCDAAGNSVCGVVG